MRGFVEGLTPDYASLHPGRLVDCSRVALRFTRLRTRCVRAVPRMERSAIRELLSPIVMALPHSAALHAGYDFAISHLPHFIL
jgi:hypothetical protein